MLTRSSLALWVLLSSQAACVRDARQSAPVDAPDRGAVLLQVQTEAEGGTGRRPIGPGEVLHAGDRFDLKLEAGQAAYVYVVSRSGHTPLALLFPVEQGAQHLMQPGQPEHLPPGEGWFRLLGAAEAQTLYVVASTRALTQELIGQVLADGAQDRDRDADPPRPPPPPPPDKTTNRDRGYDKLRQVYWGRLDERGIAVLRFPFRQE